MSNAFIEKITLTNFRNFNFAEFEFTGDRILITGPNGSGKTSLLESISLLSPGKGLRGEKHENFISSGATSAKITCSLNSYLGKVTIDESIDSLSNSKSIYMNDKKIRSSELLNFLNIFWLTPQQNITFQESSSFRRKFFDRIVYSFFASHASEINKYEHLQTERLKYLTNNQIDDVWLNIIEDKMCSIAVNICRQRHEILQKLNDTIKDLKQIPKVSLKLSSKIDKIISCSNDYAIEISEEFKKSRQQDQKSHKNNFGPMKSDFSAHFIPKNMDISLCSTGEQQSALIAILVGHTELFLENTRRKPILLLDELFVHLDESNKEILANFIATKNIQIFVTSTEKDLCADFFKHSYELALIN